MCFDGVPKVGEWVGERLAGLLADCGAPAGWDPRFSPHLILLFSTPELMGDATVPASAGTAGRAPLALVGPACPTQLRVFLQTLSIADDVLAVSVIGVFYSKSIHDPRYGMIRAL